MDRADGGSTAAVFLPAEVVLGVAQQLVTSGQVDHGWLGVETSDVGSANPVTVETATTSAGTSPPDGARLDSVDQNSPAAEAGLQPGDVVVGIDGNPVHSKSELAARLYPEPAGDHGPSERGARRDDRRLCPSSSPRGAPTRREVTPRRSMG